MEKDLITQLGDDILVSIICNLSLKEAIRTSVLSHRWRDLWNFTSKLDFHLGNVDLGRERGRSIRRVNRVLETHEGTSLDEFTLCVDFGGRNFHRHIDRWLTFALERSVKRLDLNVIWGYKYSLSQQFLHNFRLDSLTVLRLNRVDVTGDFVEQILRLCPFLEVLSVQSSISLRHLKVSGPLLKLRHLEILCCELLYYVEISATNLLSFKYSGRCRRIIVFDAPCLVEASVRGLCAYYFLKNISQFSNYLSQLKTFDLDVTSIQRIGSCPIFPKLRNLKRMDLEICANDAYNLLYCSSLLMKSPFLYSLKVKILASDFKQRKMKVRKAKPHRCLKVVELGGFPGYAFYVELARHLVKRVVSLEKLVIHSRAYYDLSEFQTL